MQLKNIKYEKFRITLKFHVFKNEIHFKLQNYLQLFVILSKFEF